MVILSGLCAGFQVHDFPATPSKLFSNHLSPDEHLPQTPILGPYAGPHFGAVFGAWNGYATYDHQRLRYHVWRNRFKLQKQT